MELLRGCRSGFSEDNIMNVIDHASEYRLHVACRKRTSVSDSHISVQNIAE